MTSLDQGVWQHFGFRSNPLDPRPLSVSHQDRELMVGRDQENRKFAALSSNDHGVIIVEGNIGVGKTSFVNAAQYDLSKRGFLPSHQTIEVRENMEPSNLVLSALSNLVYSLELAKGRDANMKDLSLREGKQLVANTVKGGWGGQLSILGTGGGVQRQETIEQAPTIIINTALQKLDKWIERAKEKFSYRAGIVVINNLDRLLDQELVELLNRARDVALLRPNILWTLIGKVGTFTTIEGQARRVSEIITGQPILLNPLSLEKIHEAIHVRVNKFAARKEARFPLESRFIDLLYEVSQGEIRFIFKRLTDIVYEVVAELPSVDMIPSDLAFKVLTKLAEQRLSQLPLTESDKRMLQNMAQHPFRIKDYKEFKLSSQQALLNRVRRLQKMELLQSERRDAKMVIYRTVADVNIVFRKDK
ncbi:hypothetical protein AUI46_02890 [archaeon 13_1_40CM_2_52_13]|nr:MAG: hypothetical protein AUI46_02890 [archaeon 13_1_40CM_2_52_13]